MSSSDPLRSTTTTTGGANWAPVILISSIISICAITVCFPIMLYRLVNGNLPHVDRYTELGRRRGAREEDREYRRVLERDDNPVAFLYKGYRRRCGGYRAYYLLVKLSVLVVVAVFSKDNCLFRSVLPRATIEVIRQGVLLFFLLIWLAVQVVLRPFNDLNGNASEVVSRSTYIAVTLVGLLVALDVRGSSFLNTYVLYLWVVLQASRVMEPNADFSVPSSPASWSSRTAATSGSSCWVSTSCSASSSVRSLRPPILPPPRCADPSAFRNVLQGGRNACCGASTSSRRTSTSSPGRRPTSSAASGRRRCLPCS